MDAPVLVTGQVDHPGEHPRALRGCLVQGVVPHVLIDSQSAHAVEPGLVGGQVLKVRLHRAPQRPPRHREPAGQTQDGGMLGTQLADRPVDRPRRDRPSGGDQGGNLLTERAPRAAGVRARPPALTPHDLDGDRPGHVMQDSGASSSARGHDPAVRATHQRPRRLDRDPQSPVVTLDSHHLDTVQAEQHIASRARVSSGRADSAPRSVVHRRGPRGTVCLVATDPEDLDLHHHATRLTGASQHSHRICEEPVDHRRLNRSPRPPAVARLASRLRLSESSERVRNGRQASCLYRPGARDRRSRRGRRQPLHCRRLFRPPTSTQEAVRGWCR
ncbi:hypothetical protein GALL_291840 [mine drainage metagenome]|uniref:Uncharacterized protein n=1 Tax=mine drainage metagenome TaxID=410659 RepID=A0A1J5R079_9ZZZZ